MSLTDTAPDFITGAGGLRLAVDRYGPETGRPVLLLHGGGQTRHAWGATARRLGGLGYHVLSQDLRGHGDSAWAAAGDYGFERFRDDVLAVRATFGRPPVLVGASLGGIASLLAVGEGPADTAAALVLVDITPQIGGAGSDHIVAFMKSGAAGFANVEEAADAVAGYLPHRPRPRNPAGLMKNLRERDGRLHWHWDPSFLGSGGEDRSQASARLSDCARRVTVPTLLVRGDMSEVVSEEDAAALTRLIPHAAVADVRGAGHMVAGDQNTVFGDAVTDWLARTAPAH